LSDPHKGNALANNRKVITSASNNFFKNKLFLINSNRASTNAYHDENYNIKTRKDTKSLENNPELPGKISLNYFGHREKHNNRLSSRESTQKMK